MLKGYCVTSAHVGQGFIGAGQSSTSRNGNRQMNGHIVIIEALTAYLEQGVGNAAAIQAKIAWHKAWLAERGVFVA